MDTLSNLMPTILGIVGFGSFAGVWVWAMTVYIKRYDSLPREVKEQHIRNALARRGYF